MQIADLKSCLLDEIGQRAKHLALQKNALRLDYVLNAGGFVNASFTLTDGIRRYHVKVAKDPECADKLRRWLAVHFILESRYHAPKIVESFASRDEQFFCVLFEHVDGSIPPSLPRRTR